MNYRGMKLVVNKIKLITGYKAMTIYKWIFVRRPENMKQIDVNHEYLHKKQFDDLLIIFFPIWYITEFIIKLLLTFKLKPFSFDWDKAYKGLSFEQEAYKYQEDDEYLDNRKPYSWLKYVFRYKKEE